MFTRSLNLKSQDHSRRLAVPISQLIISVRPHLVTAFASCLWPSAAVTGLYSHVNTWLTKARQYLWAIHHWATDDCDNKFPLATVQFVLTNRKRHSNQKYPPQPTFDTFSWKQRKFATLIQLLRQQLNHFHCLCFCFNLNPRITDRWSTQSRQ